MITGILLIQNFVLKMKFSNNFRKPTSPTVNGNLPEHSDEFHILIQDNPFDVMCLLETWLNSKWSDSELLIDGYNIIRSEQQGSQSGAETAIYHSSKRMARQRTNINFNLDIEASWLEITLKNRSTS